jgi:hypothetical protein
MGKKLLGWIAVAFGVFFVLKNPAGAAATANHIGAGLGAAATSVAAFFTALVGGGRR